MALVDNLKWRYATKIFDPTKKISKEDLNKIMRTVQLSASSYGLQLYKVLIIENRDLREKLKPVSWGQNQITEASHLVVFCNYTEVEDKHIDEYMELKAKTEKLKIAELKDYGDFVKEKIGDKSKDERINWTARQTYIALGNLLSACAELKIDACPMEGFEFEKYNEILNLSEQGLNASVIATIGYRSEKDETQHCEKTRKPIEKLFKSVSKIDHQEKKSQKNEAIISFMQALTMGFIGATAVFTASFFHLPIWVLFVAWVSYYLFGAKPKSSLLIFIQQILGILIAITIQYGGGQLTQYIGMLGNPVMVFIVISAVFYISKAKYLNNIPAYFLGMIVWFGLQSEIIVSSFLLLVMTLIVGFTFAWLNETLSKKIK